MKSTENTAVHGGPNPNLLFMDGTDTHKSYAVVARRGWVFLGIKLSGLTDGSKSGVPGKTYLHARVRSARDQALAKEIGLQSDPGNVVSLVEKQLALDEAWPNLPFEKVDNDRASLHVGAFVQGSLVANAALSSPASSKATSFANSSTMWPNRLGHPIASRLQRRWRPGWPVRRSRCLAL